MDDRNEQPSGSVGLNETVSLLPALAVSQKEMTRD